MVYLVCFSFLMSTTNNIIVIIGLDTYDLHPILYSSIVYVIINYEIRSAEGQIRSCLVIICIPRYTKTYSNFFNVVSSIETSF